MHKSIRLCRALEYAPTSIDEASDKSAAYYLRVIWFMYFDEAEDKSVFQANLDTRVVLSLNGAAVLALGIVPGWLLALCVDVFARS